VISIDQEEELFKAEGQEEASLLLRTLGALAATDSPATMLLFTIRSDAYERLQIASEFAGLRQQTYSQPPMPRGAYIEVITGPARRLGDTPRKLSIEPSLVAQLLADIDEGGGKDALPLLAFTLERLYTEHGGDGDLRLTEYRELGGIKGAIEAAIQRALQEADDDRSIPQGREARLVLLRRGLIPWPASIDPETGKPERRVAQLPEIPPECRALIDKLVQQRLLITDVDRASGETTLEPVHDAVLRQWDDLQGWLREDTALLIILDCVKRAARDWAENGRVALWLSHTGGRLQGAENLRSRPDLALFLTVVDGDYLSACRSAETASRRWSRRVYSAVAVLGALLVAAGIGWWQQDWLKRQYHWHVVMRPTLLSVADEIVHATTPRSEFKECVSGCPEMVVSRSVVSSWAHLRPSASGGSIHSTKSRSPGPSPSPSTS
jgi:hypothetical protein